MVLLYEEQTKKINKMKRLIILSMFSILLFASCDRFNPTHKAVVHNEPLRIEVLPLRVGGINLTSLEGCTLSSRARSVRYIKNTRVAAWKAVPYTPVRGSGFQPEPAAANSQFSIQKGPAQR